MNCFKSTTERANSLVPGHGYYVIDQSSDLVDKSNVPSNYPKSVPVFLVIRETSNLSFVELMQKQSNVALLVERGGSLEAYLERLNRNYIRREDCYSQLAEHHKLLFKQELDR